MRNTSRFRAVIDLEGAIGTPCWVRRQDVRSAGIGRILRETTRVNDVNNPLEPALFAP